MHDRCVRDQWRATDLDWSQPAPRLAEDKERAVVQYFTDMAAIELLAGALFEVQRAHAEAAGETTLAAIFATFVVDERRHSAVARRLARHYDTRKDRVYIENPTLTRFRPHFLHVVRRTSPELANAYITAGELLLDIALLRSLDDYVADDTSHRAMELINRDESRHIAIDFFMTERYSSDAHQAAMRARPLPSPRVLVEGIRAVATMMWHARPFLRDVFLRPMQRTDPAGKRTREAFKRIQLVMRKPQVARTPFGRFMTTTQDAFNHPVLGRALAPVLLRMLGAEPEVAKILYSDDELARTQRMTFDELAEEALAAKTR
jgi:hypothetical protein